MRRMRPIGTPREIADSNILRFQRALDAIPFGGTGNPAIIRMKLDQWLEYRMMAMQDGTLDEERYL